MREATASMRTAVEQVRKVRRSKHVPRRLVRPQADSAANLVQLGLSSCCRATTWAKKPLIGGGHYGQYNRAARESCRREQEPASSSQRNLPPSTTIVPNTIAAAAARQTTSRASTLRGTSACAAS